MTIDGTGSVDAIGKDAKVHRNNDVAKQTKSDEVEFSKESRVKGELQVAKEQVNNVAEVRTDRVAAARQKIDDPAYLNDPHIIDTIAERIADLFLS